MDVTDLPIGERMVFAQSVADGIKAILDQDDRVVLRLAELRGQGEKATVRIEWTLVDKGTRFVLMIRRADGTIERAPSSERARAPHP